MGLRFNLIQQIRRSFSLFSPRSHWPCLLVVIIGLGASSLAYTMARYDELRDIRLLFAREAQTQAGAFESLAAAYWSKCGAMADFFQSMPNVSPADFSMFARGMLARRANLLDLKWAPRVREPDRASFERQMRQAGHLDFALSEMIDPDQVVPAARRAEYFPVTLTATEPPQHAGLGMDMGQCGPASEALFEAGRSGELRLGPPMSLLQAPGRHDGIMAFAPVYRPGAFPATPAERWAGLRGFVVAAYQLGPMLEEALDPFDQPAIAVDHRLYLQQQDGRYQSVAQSPRSPADTDEIIDAAGASLLEADPFRIARRMDMGGRNWLLVAQPRLEAIDRARSWVPLGMFLAGLLFTGAVAGSAWLLIARTTEIENMVTERTRQLGRANEELSKENERRMAAKAELAQALRQERAALASARGVQEQLAISEARYRVMGETIPYGVWLADAQGGPQYFSQSFLELLGMTLVDARDFGWARRLSPEDTDTTVARIKAAIDRGGALDVENRFRARDGTDRVVLMRGLPVRDAAGRITSWVGINLDITQRKQAEEELRQHRDYLEELVRSRTLELMIANEELRRDIEQRGRVEEALRRLQESLEEQVKARTAELADTNRELEAFSYSVSHDLRAPLRHVVGFVQLLQKHSWDRLDEPGRRHLQVITQAATRMGQLIDDLLKFSRLGRAAMKLGPVSLSALVEDVRQELAGQGEDHEVEWIVDDELPVVQADAALLRIVLTNLLSNAMKYSRTREHPRIEIGSACDEESRSTIYIRDNGVGFDMQYADRLFGVFQRLHKAEEFEGTGIGLAIVQRIISRHGGAIRAEATIDGGATFYLSLPCAKERDAKLEANTAGRR